MAVRARAAAISLRSHTVRMFLDSLPHVLQRERSGGLDAVYHFSFTGSDQTLATVVIRNKRIEVHAGHTAKPDLHVIADAQTWLGFLAKEKSLLRALLTRRIRIKGPIRMMAAFGRCFPA